jgi:DNA-binding transcriptional LysR family regulator
MQGFDGSAKLASMTATPTTSTLLANSEQSRGDVSLQQLRMLLAVEASGNVTEAAYALDLSQSTVSHGLASLEAALGAKLFIRGRHGAQVTEAGQRVAVHARAMLQHFEAMGQELSEALTGTVRIASIRSGATTILPQLLQDFHKLHPGVTFSFVESNGEPKIILELLMNHQADIAVGDLAVYGSFHIDTPASVRSWPIAQDEFVLLWPADGRSTQPSLAEIAAQPTITSSETCGTVMKSYWQRQGWRLEPVFVANDDSVLMAMVGHGLGITMMPRLAAHPLPPGVKAFALPDAPKREIRLLALQQTLNTPLVRTVVRFLTRYGAKV